MADLLAQPLDLPCGERLKNRMIKSAMSDSLGDGAGSPTAGQIRLYERWAQGGAALSMIGEVQITPDYPEKAGNLVLVPDAKMDELARHGQQNGAKLWPQLGHAGALSYAPISQPRGPSPLNIKGLRCAGMSLTDIRALPGLYARAAALARRFGFGGVQIHAGHGFLLSQFLSPLFNHRIDDYGGDVIGRFRVVGDIIAAVRDAVGPSLPIGIRINATDRLMGGLTPEEALHVVRLLDRTSVDLIDISGGTYFPGAPASSDGVSDGAYFAEFAKQAKALTDVPIMLTGGVRTRDQAHAVLADGAADAIGLARAMALDPDLPRNWLRRLDGPAFPRFAETPPGGVTAWYSMRLTALGEDAEDSFDMSLPEALAAYDARDEARCKTWRARFRP